eukprot:CAMPEP_0168562616 /NCGR_PEP_ID=MMETSP0413-20121227/12226_1 /TAXON_ID=136452 /ORGANISM="Filamoeba nolandi, Strain NC-AS-23-1" /LENGTH=199 /DNA_ID=CAMNT_0008594071 /DNA_START=13 /DNA_END=609 /DNA_ORIENTATION=-
MALDDRASSQSFFVITKEDRQSAQISKTTLWEAAANSDLARITVIVEEGKVNINSLDNLGKTPLHHAVMNAHKAAIKLLIKQGADINATDSHNVAAIDAVKSWPNEESPRSYILKRLAIPPPFVPDTAFEKCQCCSSEFSLTNRRHHCRYCGQLLCAECTPRQAKLPFTMYSSPVRVCNRCVEAVPDKLSGLEDASCTI